jgi:hypothetical protein
MFAAAIMLAPASCINSQAASLPTVFIKDSNTSETALSTIAAAVSGSRIGGSGIVQGAGSKLSNSFTFGVGGVGGVANLVSQESNGIEAPVCSPSGGRSPSVPKCIDPYAETFTYIETLGPRQVRYYRVVPRENATVMTVEYVSRDQRADCSIFVQEGSIKNIETNLNDVYNYALQNGFMGRRYNSTINGHRTFSNFSRMTSEGVAVLNPLSGVGYYFAIRNEDRTLSATIILFSAGEVAAPNSTLGTTPVPETKSTLTPVDCRPAQRFSASDGMCGDGRCDLCRGGGGFSPCLTLPVPENHCNCPRDCL